MSDNNASVSRRVDGRQLGEWEKLAAAATPGPWEAGLPQWARHGAGKAPISAGRHGTVGVVYNVTGSGVVAGWSGLPDDADRAPRRPPDDALFIAAARTAIPELCAEVRRLAAAHKMDGKLLEEAHAAYVQQKAEIEHLRSALRAIKDQTGLSSRVFEIVEEALEDA